MSLLHKSTGDVALGHAGLGTKIWPVSVCLASSHEKSRAEFEGNTNWPITFTVYVGELDYRSILA